MRLHLSMAQKLYLAEWLRQYIIDAPQAGFPMIDTGEPMSIRYSGFKTEAAVMNYFNNEHDVEIAPATRNASLHTERTNAGWRFPVINKKMVERVRTEFWGNLYKKPTLSRLRKIPNVAAGDAQNLFDHADKTMIGLTNLIAELDAKINNLSEQVSDIQKKVDADSSSVANVDTKLNLEIDTLRDRISAIEKRFSY